MAIYNAFCDRVPVYLIAGNALDINAPAPGVEWDHSVQDAAAIVRDCLKWDDVPISLAHFRGVRRARLQNRDDAAHGARCCWWPTANCRRARFPTTRSITFPKLTLWLAAAGRFRLGGRSGAHAGGRGKSRDSSGAHRAHGGRLEATSSSLPKRCRRR